MCMSVCTPHLSTIVLYYYEMYTLGIDLLHEAAPVIFIADAEVFDQIPLFQLTCKVRSKVSIYFAALLYFTYHCGTHGGK